MLSRDPIFYLSDGLMYVNEVIDCGDRGVVGYCISKRCREEAVWALEDACLQRFGILPTEDAGVTVLSDNGLVFASKLYRRLLKSYGLQQEFTHPHAPEQNGGSKPITKRSNASAFGNTDPRRPTKRPRSSPRGLTPAITIGRTRP